MYCTEVTYIRFPFPKLMLFNMGTGDMFYILQRPLRMLHFLLPTYLFFLPFPFVFPSGLHRRASSSSGYTCLSLGSLSTSTALNSKLGTIYKFVFLYSNWAYSSFLHLGNVYRVETDLNSVLRYIMLYFLWVFSPVIAKGGKRVLRSVLASTLFVQSGYPAM